MLTIEVQRASQGNFYAKNTPLNTNLNHFCTLHGCEQIVPLILKKILKIWTCAFIFNTCS